MKKYPNSRYEEINRMIQENKKLFAEYSESIRKAKEEKKRCPRCGSKVVTKKAFDKRRNVEYDRHWCRKCQKYVVLTDEIEEKEKAKIKKLLDRYTVTRLQEHKISYRVIQTLLSEYSLGTICNWANEKYVGSFTKQDAIKNVRNILNNNEVAEKLIAQRSWQNILDYLINEALSINKD